MFLFSGKGNKANENISTNFVDVVLGFRSKCLFQITGLRATETVDRHLVMCAALLRLSFA